MRWLEYPCSLSLLALMGAAPSVSADLPWFVQQAKLSADDPTDRAYFGAEVAISGDTALVWGDGKVYVFERSEGAWVQDMILLSEHGAYAFAAPLAVADGMALVGDIHDDTLGTYAGAVQIYQRSGNTWIHQGKLVGDDTDSGDQFGYSLALSGDTLVVGAFSDEFTRYHGAAYVFVWDGTAWIQQARLATDEPCYWFGYSVGLDGDTLLVGAPAAYPYGPLGCFKDPLPPDAAFVYVRDGDSWSLQSKLLGGGHSVAISGDTAMLPAWVAGGTEAEEVSGVRVFLRQGSLWTVQAELTTDKASDFLRDYTVALAGDMALVGAVHDDAAGLGSGAVYVFTRQDATWSRQEKFTAEDSLPRDRFGRSMALSGSTLLVGAPGDWASASAGAAYVFGPADADGDGVIDSLDVCPGTAIPEGVPLRRLGPNRFALVDDDGVFDTFRPGGARRSAEFTVEQTGGCSCEQIVEALDLGAGHLKFGCSQGVMKAWVGLVNP